MVPTTFGWLWPSAVTAMPPVKSRYSLPSLAHTRTPSPRTSATGARLAVVIRCLSAHSISVLVSVMAPSWMCASIRHIRSARLRLPSPCHGCCSQDYLGADTFLGQHFQQDRVGYAPVDDVGLLGAAGERPQRGLHPGQHASVDHALLDQPLRLALGERRDQAPVLPVDAG